MIGLFIKMLRASWADNELITDSWPLMKLESDYGSGR